jgi:hypothetical protein
LAVKRREAGSGLSFLRRMRKRGDRRNATKEQWNPFQKEHT